MTPKIKAFDCVAESRQWREVASAKLNAMSQDEELAYLHALGERVRSQLRDRQEAGVASPAAALVLREEPPEYGVKQA